MVKLLIIFLLANGGYGSYESNLRTIEDCANSVQAAPVIAEKRGLYLIAVACIEPKNMEYPERIRVQSIDT